MIDFGLDVKPNIGSGNGDPVVYGNGWGSGTGHGKQAGTGYGEGYGSGFTEQNGTGNGTGGMLNRLKKAFLS